MLNLFLMFMLVDCVFMRALNLATCFGRMDTSGECHVPNVNHLHPSRAYSGGFSSQTHFNPSLMITLDHLEESFVLNLHITYIEDNACFKFGVGGLSLCFKNFPALVFL